MAALRHAHVDRLPFSHQIVLWVCMSVFVCCVWVEVDKTLCKAGIIVLISYSYFDSFLICGKILFSCGGLAYYPVSTLYVFFNATLLINRSALFFF